MKKEVLTEYETEKILKKYVPVSKNQLIHSISEIKLKKYPLVLKIMSKQVIHKSDIKGVRIVNNKEELEKNFNDLIKISKKKKIKLQGILVQEFHDGHQLILGGKKDPVFGQIMIIGGGGIFTEIMKDVSIRACPITKEDAFQMLGEIKYSKVLEGYRGEKVNLDKLTKIMINFSKLMNSRQDVLELDINPLIASKNGIYAVDARMVLEK